MLAVVWLSTAHGVHDWRSGSHWSRGAADDDAALAVDYAPFY